MTHHILNNDVYEHESGTVHEVMFPRNGWTEHYITVHAKDATSVAMFDTLAHAIKKADATIVSQYVFGGNAYYSAGMLRLTEACGRIDWPLTWLQGDACNGDHVTGTQVFAVSGKPVERIRLNGSVQGTVLEDGDLRYCILGGLAPTDKSTSREAQSDAMFQGMDHILGQAGMSFSNIARTWLYLDDLLSWYDAFNVVRTDFFHKHGVFQKLVPASTGIGAANPYGTAIHAGALAVASKTNGVKVEAVPSPMQCPALDYKSSFSRAVEIHGGDHRRLFISGTASIEPGGKTVYLDDPAKQIDLTMEVAHAILESRGMDWSNTCKGIAYFKDMDYVPLYHKWLEKNNLPALPLVIAHTDVCRHDLLYEVELDAIASA